MLYIENFSFSISPPEYGWMYGKISLFGKTIDYRMSAVLGDDIDDLLNMLWSHIPGIEDMDAKYQWDIDDDRFPRDSFVINEEGSKIIWTVSHRKKNYIHLQLDAVYDSDFVEDKRLEADIPFYDFASVIMTAIDEMINKCGLLNFKQNWDKPFPLTTFLTLKSVFTNTNTKTYDDELRFLRTPFRMPKMRGHIRKFTLVSDNLCYGPAPELTDITKQRLTITDAGKVYIKKYAFSGETVESNIINIPEEDAVDIIGDLVGFINYDITEVFMTDVGSWDLCFTNDDGDNFKFAGSLYYDSKNYLSGFSRDIRRLLNRWDLLVFDGNTYQEGSGIKFCSCEFQSGGNTYYYITEDPDIQEGDDVVVPVGEHGRTAIAKVVEIEFFEENDVPMPLESVKTILEKIEEDL